MLDETVFKSASLCVVGNVNRDVKIAPLPANRDIRADGGTSTRSIIETIGGGGANSACTSVSLGASTMFIGKIGNDALGLRIERALRRHGLRTRLARDGSSPTGTSIAIAFEDGHRHFISCLPNNESLAFADLGLQGDRPNPTVGKGFRHLLRADIWFSQPMLDGGNERLLEWARDRGMATSIDINWDPAWGVAPTAEVRRRKAAVRKILPLVDLAHGNARELCEFADCQRLADALSRIERWGVGAVVVHLGDKGAGYYHKGKLVVEGPSPARTHVNTTGTGDVLSVCMMLMHYRPDIPASDRLRFANRIVAEFIEGRREFIPALDD